MNDHICVICEEPETGDNQLIETPDGYAHIRCLEDMEDPEPLKPHEKGFEPQENL